MSGDHADRATHRILDAAEAEFARHGVAASTMAAIARRAGCSRATVYAYFPNRRALRLAVANRAAIAVARQVETAIAPLDDPRRRLVEGILGAVATVRATPALACWFTPGEVALVHEISDSSAVIATIVSGFTDTVADDDRELRARWILRVIVSLLTMPGRDAAEERALLERFVAGIPTGAPA